VEERAAEDNISFDIVFKPKQITVARYKVLAAATTERRIVTGVQQKTEIRLIAENSIMSTTYYLLTIAVSHLIVCANK